MSSKQERLAQLSQTLNDETASIEERLRAANTIGEIEHPDAIALLRQALEINANPTIRQHALAILERVALIQAIPSFCTALVDDDDDVRQAAMFTLGSAIEYLSARLQSDNAAEQARAKQNLEEMGRENIGRILVDDNRDTVRQAAAIALGEMGGTQAINYLRKALDMAGDLAVISNPSVVVSVISALRQIGDPQVIPDIGRRLNEDVSSLVRRRAARALQQLNHVEAIPYLSCALINDSNNDVRQAAESALVSLSDWQLKTNRIIDILDGGEQERAEIEEMAIFRAIKPSANLPTTNKYVLTDYLIRRAVAYTLNENRRMTAVMAAVIIASVDGSIILANERLDEYRNNTNIQENKLRLLRIEINPVLKVLQYNLEANFQEPIARLNDETRTMWTETIKHAQNGFRARMYMSIITFGIGVLLVLGAFFQVMFGNAQPEQLWGSGVSFAGGITTMLLTIYSGPLKEIRRSVSDLGIASAAFIAYIHRVLEVSHTFSFYYLNQTIDFDQMEKSSVLIEQAMNSTIERLDAKESLKRQTNRG